MSKPVILIILSYYLPGQRGGGPIRTTANMVEALGDQFEFRILTGDRDFGDGTPYPHLVPGEWIPVGKASVRYLSPQEQGIGHLRHILATAAPYDLLYLDSVFTSSTIKTLLLYRARLVPRKPIIVVPRGHLNPGALSLKSTKMRRFLRVANLVGLYRNLIWHVSSDSERQDVLREFPATRPASIRVIANLPTALAPPAFQPPLKQPGQLRLVFLSRISRKKNLHFALDALKNLHGEVEFDIWGPLEDQAYWHECLALIETLPPNVKVTYRGTVAFDQVVATFAEYHLFFFPTLGENFGHVILEALCAGCPVLTSDQTIWGGLPAQGAGYVFPLDQPAAFQQALDAMIALDQAGFTAMARHALDYGSRYLHDPARLAAMIQLFHSVLQQGG